MATVKLFASLRKDAGIKETLIPGTSIMPVISELVRQYPALADKLLENGQVRPHVVVTINGHPTTDMDAPITEQDLIAIFPPIAGG
jgi:molybdopterin synthase sulfur carrier subunit